MIARWMEITFILILVFLVITNANGFDTVATAIGRVYTSAVKTLQGRG